MKDLFAVCTKCGGIETGENLSRFCPQCNYMRLVRREGETIEQARERDSAPFTEAERAELDARCGWPDSLARR